MVFINLKKYNHASYSKREIIYSKTFFVKNPKIKQCEVVGHFLKEGIARQTVYNAFNRHKNAQSIRK